MYSVLINFVYCKLTKCWPSELYFDSWLSRDRYYIFAIRLKNYCMLSDYKHVQLCCMPTVFGINYDSALTAATKPMDQYFCFELWVEPRISQVVDVIDQQPVRRGAAICAEIK